MSKFIISELAREDLEDHLAYIVRKDGIDRASSIYDQIIEKIEQIANAPFQLGKRKDNYLVGLRKLVFKRLNIYFTYKDNHVYIERIISGYRDQDRQFKK